MTSGERPPDLRRFCQTDTGHGRIETREIMTSCEYMSWYGWPGLRQIIRVERRVETKRRGRAGKCSIEVAYFITSLDRKRASPERLLQLIRQHWMIENGLHRTRDTLFAEDARTCRRGAIPQALACLTNLAITLLSKQNSSPTIAREFFAEHRQAALTMATLGFY